MNCESPSANISLLVSRYSLRGAISRGLNQYVGRNRRYTVKELSNATGVADRVIESAKLDPDDPDFRPLREENLASVSKFLGVPFVSLWLEPMGLGAFELSEQPPLPQMLDACKSPDRLTKEDHIRKAREHLNAAEEME